MILNIPKAAKDVREIIKKRDRKAGSVGASSLGLNDGRPGFFGVSWRIERKPNKITTLGIRIST